MPELAISSDLAARIERLEAQSRRLRRLSFVTTILLVAAVAIGAAGSTSKTRQVVVVDGAGHTRVRLDAAGLHILDARGHERIYATVDSFSLPEFGLTDNNGVKRLRGYISANNNPNLKFIDAASNNRFWVDSSSMSFYDTKGTERTVIGVTEGNDAILHFYDGSHTQRMSLGMSTTENPILWMWDSSHNDRAFFGAYADGSFGADFKNAYGTTTWSAP